MRVLFVGSDNELVSVGQALADGAGYCLFKARSADEATQHLPTVAPHVMVIEHPDADGRGALKTLAEMRRLYPHSYAVMVVHRGGEDRALEALRAGACNYLHKPVHQRLLGHILGGLAQKVDRLEKRQSICRHVQRHHLRLSLPSDVNLVGAAADYITELAEAVLPDIDAGNIQLGLEELIRNAIEHGNLEVGFEAKANALSEFRLLDLINERARDPRLGARRVLIDARFEGGAMHAVIEDEGPGFDYHNCWNPLSDEGLAQLNGRGIFLTRAFFDEITYTGRGNRVELVKRAG